MNSNLLDYGVADYPVARKEIFYGIWIVIILSSFLLLWAFFVSLPTAAIAPGLVGVEGYRKTVQHFEGGIVHEILVKDGDYVTEGQALIVLDKLHNQSDQQLLGKQQTALLALQARLIAENRTQKNIEFPAVLLTNKTNLFVRHVINEQQDTFQTRRQLLQEQNGILTEQIAQAVTKVEGLKQQIQALQKQQSLIFKELKEYRVYVQKGLVKRSQVFSLERQKVQIDADLAKTNVAITTTKQEISALKLRLAELNQSHKNKVLKELSTTQKQLLEIERKLTKTNDRLARSNILAPITGVVVGLKVHTTGGVIKPAEPLLDIVPDQKKMIVEAKVDPKDRDTIRIGQEAEVRFTAFNERNTKPIPGKVSHISADRFINKASQIAYYSAKIELSVAPEKILNGAPIFPGMQAEVIILTGTRTALSYMLDPFTQSFNRAFKED